MSNRTDDALFQSSLSRPPRRGSVIAVTVDSTARSYDVSTIPLVPANGSRVFIALQADGGALYYYFSSTSDDDLDESDIIAAGDTLLFSGTMGVLLPNGAVHEVAIDAATDIYLVVKTVSTDATLRIFQTSDIV